MQSPGLSGGAGLGGGSGLGGGQPQFRDISKEAAQQFGQESNIDPSKISGHNIAGGPTVSGHRVSAE